LINGLGPTESTVTLQDFVQVADDIDGDTIAVGRPVPDTEVYLLGDDGSISESEGEITYRSEHLAVEYWKRPELTAKAFIDDPNDPRLRSYRTGDLGGWRSDGVLEFLGRKDFQVKVHGVRIELGEIESRLRNLDDVCEALVVASADDTDDIELAAYLTTHPGTQFHAGQVRQRLAEILPT
jgi:non-ribosomal peptide synthetase component F